MVDGKAFDVLGIAASDKGALNFKGGCDDESVDRVC